MKRDPTKPHAFKQEAPNPKYRKPLFKWCVCGKSSDDPVHSPNKGPKAEAVSVKIPPDMLRKGGSLELVLMDGRCYTVTVKQSEQLGKTR